MQIQRSQNLKLHFYGHPKIDPHIQTQLFELLTRHSSRWEELSLGLISEMVPLLAPLRHRVSSLKNLWIQWNQSEAPAVESIDCFQTASSLVDVGILNEYNFVPIALPVHQLHQLTRYQLDSPWDSHKGILKFAPNLIEAHITISFDDTFWAHSSDETIDLLYLRRLFISDSKILSYLNIPALEEIAFAVEGRQTTFVIAELIQSLLDRSACPLRRLCLKLYPDATAICKILQMFSSITELVILINNPTAREEVNDLVTALTVTEWSLERSTVLAPHLSLLCFGCSGEDNCIDYAAYLEMLKSRWKADICALETAALLTFLAPEPDHATLNGLDVLRQEGLNVLLRDGVEARAEMDSWTCGTAWNY
ncbi:hypothetical protein B0H19DRAFT_1060536 [Mycena capillaripes]|nr:hypothetical protein B0H19DRAFT_1060536 [Mycena capillaripes]